MKALRYILILALVLGLVGFVTSSTSAQKFSYVSGIQIQNLSDATANIVIDYYAGGTGVDAGTLVTSTSRTVDPNTMIFYFPIPIDGSFNGSVVISSDSPLGAISNILSSDYKTQASYVGFSAGTNSVYLPLLDKGNSGWDSWFTVQNTGSSDATVTITYGDCVGNQPLPVTIKPNASKSFYQAAEACHTTKIFPATITSTQPIAAVVLRETTAVMTAYSGFGAAATKPVMPLINSNNGGILTGVNIFNQSATETVVTVSYTPSMAGTACSEQQTIPGNSMKTFALFAFARDNAGEDCANGVKFIGAGAVTANSANAPLTSVITQFTSVDGAMYGGFDPATATSKVVYPTIFDRRGSQNLWTSLSAMNVGTLATTVNCTFTNSTYSIGPVVLDPGEGLNDIQYNKIAYNYVGGATCIATGGDAKIVGQVNEIAQTFLRISDGFMIYEGINQ